MGIRNAAIRAGPYIAAAAFVSAIGLTTLFGGTRVEAQDPLAAQDHTEHAIVSRALEPVVHSPIAQLPVVQGQLGYAPYAAPPGNRDYQALVEIELMTTEEAMEIATGAENKVENYNGSVQQPTT